MTKTERVNESKYVWFTAPKKTKRECPKSEFADRHYHRVGVYKGDRPSDGGLDGWSLKAECVNCGKQFKHPYFLLNTKDGER